MLKMKYVAPIAASAIALFATSANAVQILGYSQSAGVNTVTVTTVGNATTISSSTGIAVGNYAGGGAPFAAFIQFTATNTNAATLNGNTIEQKYNGVFCITSLAGCGGTNYLSGTFADDFSGQVGGASWTLSATTPPAGAVVFTSSVLTPIQLSEQRSVGLSFSNTSPALALCGTTICSATASQTGTFSAQVGKDVPEPGTLALLGLGLLGLGAARRRK